MSSPDHGIIQSMLDGLDAINWPTLTHAYGSAADVPGLLRQLLSKNKQLRSQAVSDLFGNIWHQSTVYEATASAVPFLIELLQSPATADRLSIAMLLGLIARGSSYHAVHRPSEKNEVARELIWVKNARDAVRHAIEPCLTILVTGTGDLRLAAAHILACFPEESSRTRQALVHALEVESQARARAVLGLALALLGDLRRDAFQTITPSKLPQSRLGFLAEAAAQGRVSAEDVLEVLLDLAIDSFDDEQLDSLGIA